jgi:hypothetical protein
VGRSLRDLRGDLQRPAEAIGVAGEELLEHQGEILWAWTQ